MINQESLAVLDQARWVAPFCRPVYQDYSFVAIPNTLENLLIGTNNKALSANVLGGQYSQYDCVVVFLIDGFGWKFFEKYGESYPALQRFLHQGIASQISSAFPSTTAAHLTTLHTNLEPGQTGIYEWFQYEPLVDRIVAPVLVSYAGDQTGSCLIKEGYPAHALFPFETVYQRWARHGVRSVMFQSEKIAHTPYSQTLLAGSEVRSFETFAQAVQGVCEIISKPVEQPTYLFVYWGEIDSVGHRQGIHTPAFDTAVADCCNALQDHLFSCAKSPNKTAVVITADHGMTSTDPKKTIMLNEVCPFLESTIQKNRAGELLLPAGSCRDFFLHVHPSEVDQVCQEMSKKLQSVASIFPTERLIEEGFFGSKPVSRRFLERVGNVVVLPYDNQSVFWRFRQHHFGQHFYGVHGGLSEEEMRSIFLFTELERSPLV